MPQAEKIIPFLRDNKNIGLNIIPVVSIATASGSVIAGVYALTKMLDNVEISVKKQDNLLMEYTAGNISESDYNKQADSITQELNNKSYNIQKETGVNMPVVLAGAGIIYGAYKILKKGGMLK